MRLARFLRGAELYGLPRAQRRDLERRWRKERRRAVPSSTAILRYLAALHDPAEEAKRIPGKAFIPCPNEHLRALQLESSWPDRAGPEPGSRTDPEAGATEPCPRGSGCRLRAKALRRASEGVPMAAEHSGGDRSDQRIGFRDPGAALPGRDRAATAARRRILVAARH